MALNAERKAEIVREYQRSDGDIGSPEVDPPSENAAGRLG